MIDINQLPISGGVIITGVVGVILFGGILGPLVADRTIQKSGWHQICERDLRKTIKAQLPQKQSKPKIECGAVMKLFGNGADHLCHQGGDALFDLMSIDPLAEQKEQLHRRETERLSRIAEQAPNACSCASSTVASERVTWGLYAVSARQIGGSQNLSADLTKALGSSACASMLGNIGGGQ